MRAGLGIAAAALGGCLAGVVPWGPAHAEEAWRAEFESACSRTSEAMSLSAEELSRLIARCDRIRTSVEAQEETVAKVYLKRLEKCRSLYVFMLDFKKNQHAAP